MENPPQKVVEEFMAALNNSRAAYRNEEVTNGDLTIIEQQIKDFLFETTDDGFVKKIWDMLSGLLKKL